MGQPSSDWEFRHYQNQCPHKNQYILPDCGAGVGTLEGRGSHIRWLYRLQSPSKYPCDFILTISCTTKFWNHSQTQEEKTLSQTKVWIQRMWHHQRSRTNLTWYSNIIYYIMSSRISKKNTIDTLKILCSIRTIIMHKRHTTKYHGR